MSSNGTDNKDNDGMDDIGRLIRHAGAREAVPAERMERSRARVQEHWAQVVAENKTPASTPKVISFARAAGFAAVAAVALLLAGRGLLPGPEVSEMAMVERIVGEVTVDGIAAIQGQEIALGTTLETTGAGRAALRLSSGQALRVDRNTRVSFQGSDRLAMGTGAVYIDTQGEEQSGPVSVETSLGTARDIGTQFQVRLSGSALLVGVRDGLVQVEPQDHDLFEVIAGSQVRFSADGRNETEPLDTDNPDWNWIESVAPVFDMNGASLAEYLDWYARETGAELVWADDASRSAAARITLSGDLDNSSLADSFTAVQRVAPFDYRLEDKHLWVRVE